MFVRGISPKILVLRMNNFPSFKANCVFNFFCTTKRCTFQTDWTPELKSKFIYLFSRFLLQIIQCSLSLSPPVLSPKFSSVPISPIKNTRYTAKLSYRHPPQVFRHKSRKTNLNSPDSTAHNYLLTAVYWLVIIECQNWSSDTVIDLIVEGRNRWSVVSIRIIARIYFSSDYICTFNPK
jgi:hypothetical protein